MRSPAVVSGRAAVPSHRTALAQVPPHHCALRLLLVAASLIASWLPSVERAAGATIPIPCTTLDPFRLAFGSAYVATGCTAATPIFLAECPLPGAPPQGFIDVRIEACTAAVPILHLNCSASLVATEAASLAFIAVTWADVVAPYPTAHGQASSSSPWALAALFHLQAGTASSVHLVLDNVTLHGPAPGSPTPVAPALGLIRVEGSIAARNVTVAMRNVRVVDGIDVGHPAVAVASTDRIDGVVVSADGVVWATNAMVGLWGDATTAVGIWLSIVSAHTASNVSVSIREAAFAAVPCGGTVMAGRCQAQLPISNRPCADMVVVQGVKLVADVAITAVDASWSVLFPEALLDAWVASSVVVIFRVSGYNFNDAAGLMHNATVDLDHNNAAMQCSYYGVLVWIGSTFHATNEVVSIRRSAVATTVLGRVSPEVEFRNAEVVRLCDNQGSVRGVVVFLEDLQVVHRLISGLTRAQALSDAVTTYFYMAGTGSQVLSWVSHSSDVHVTLRRVHLDADLRNGTYPPAMVVLNMFDVYSCAISASLIQISDAKHQNDAIIVVEDSSIASKTGTSLTPLSVTGNLGYLGYIASLVALMRLSNATNCTIAVSDASVHILAYDFKDDFPVVNSEMTKCYTGVEPYLNSRNITGIVVTLDMSMAELECGTSLNTNPLYPKLHIDVHVNVVRSSVAYVDTTAPHPSDLDCIVCLATLTSQADVGLTDVASIGMPIDPIGCGGCSLVDAVISIRRGVQLATLLRAGIIGSSMTNVSITAEATQFQPPMPRPGPVYVSLDPPHAIRTSAPLTIRQRLHITLVDCQLSGRHDTSHMAALVDSHYVSWGGDPSGGTGRDAAFLVELVCPVWNGTTMTQQQFDTFVTSVVPAQVVTMLNNSNCPTSPPSPGGPPPPPPAALNAQQVAANRATGAVVVGGAMVAVFAMPTAMGSVPALQASGFAVRLGRKCSADGADGTKQDASIAAASDDDDDDQIGTEIADNPLQLTLGGDLSYAGGAVVGNVVLVVGGALLLVAVKHAVRSVGALRCGEAWRWAPSPVDVRCDGVSAAIPLYGVVLQPTAAAGALLVGSSAGGGIALGVVALVLYVLPSMWFLHALRRIPVLASPLRRTRHSRRPTATTLMAACGARVRAVAELQWRWSSSHAGGLRADALLLMLEPYRGGNFGGRGMFVVEGIVTTVQGVAVGVAVARGSCAAATAALWVLTATSAFMAGYVVSVRPYAAMLDTGTTVGLNALSAVIGAVSLAQAEDAVVTAVVILQAALSAVVLLFVVALYVLDVAGSAGRRRSGIRDTASVEAATTRSHSKPPPRATAQQSPHAGRSLTRLQPQPSKHAPPAPPLATTPPLRHQQHQSLAVLSESALDNLEVLVQMICDAKRKA